MGTFILLLIIFFIVLPVLKLLWQGYKMHRQWTKATQNLRDAFNQQRQQASGQEDAGTSARSGKKKKIDPDVGEYVAFEEIACDVKSQTTTDGTTTTSYHCESQVEEAVWEDITNK